MFYYLAKANLVANALRRKSRNGETDPKSAHPVASATVCDCVD